MGRTKKETEDVESADEVVDETTESSEEVKPVKEKNSKVNPEREARWEAFLAEAEEANPEKFAVKNKNGEFEKIPSSFV